jgi:hypothetical protein
MSAGVARGAYFHQDLWAARKVFERQPVKHVDIGSRIDGFVTHCLTFREIEVIDIRPLKSAVRGLNFTQMDVMKCEQIPAEYCDSISCLHALEHFGLGRYGDPLDPNGHIYGLCGLKKLLKTPGYLLLSVPIGAERIYFDAHRVFDPKKLMLYMETQGFDLLSFSFVDDDGMFHEDVDIGAVPALFCGCGLFDLIKRGRNS